VARNTVGFSHQESHVEEYLTVLDDFLDEMCQG
jgi:hypothetical protein